MRRRSRWFAGLVVAAVALVLTMGTTTTPAAVAARATAYAGWSVLSGTSGDYIGSVQLAPRFPTATYTSDSRSGQVGVQSGASAWLPAWTPVGQVYGSSQNRPYLNLRPRADRAGEPSTTTYTFDRPTPGGWALVLGDIDADAVRVAAVTADGTPATAAQLGFRSTFNYCARTPRPSTCGGEQSDLPSWNPATRTLTGNSTATDTTGASGWFEPTVPLRTLTLEFTQRSGFPVFQTWFAVRTQDLTGTVGLTAGTCPLTGATVELRDATGAVVATTSTDAAGAYAFTGIPAGPGYAVSLGDVADTCRVVGPSRRTGIDLSGGDAVADFAVRQIIPAAIIGRVTEQGSGDPVAGATVTLTPVGGGTASTTTTDDDGEYVFDDNRAGAYSVTVTPPPGYAAASVPVAVPVVVPVGDDSPRTGNDLAVVPDPDLTGAVTAAREPVAGVVVELTGGGATRRAFTGADGTYRFDRVAAGAYTLTVPEPPEGYRTPAARTVQVAGSASTGNDFALTRPGSIGGAVRGTRPAAGVRVTVLGPDGFRRVLTTDGDGRYFLDGLAAGAYTVRLTAPDGTTATVASRSVQITDAGEVFGDEDFTLTRVTTPTTAPTTGSSGSSGSASGSGAAPATATATASATALPDTGGPSAGWLWGGGAMVLGGLVLVLVAVRLRAAAG